MEKAAEALRVDGDPSEITRQLLEQKVHAIPFLLLLPVLKSGHAGVLVIVCLHVYTVWVWFIGSGFSFFSSFTTYLASVLYTCIFTSIHRLYWKR